MDKFPSCTAKLKQVCPAEGDRRSSEGRVDVGIIQLSNDDKEDDDQEDDDKED